jgi:hypothetical protein
MSIIQISKIQQRRGLQEDLPSLSSAEFGWSIDSQRLFIGNGTIQEGAPQLGVTEILTSHSDILSVVESYTYQGASVGYAVQTGPTGSQPILRTLQQKLDDFVNIKDFGAKGDGVTNDLPAINRALFQLYCIQPSNVSARRTLYFPPGNYMISGDVVRVPTYANLMGAGKNRTIIIQSDNTQNACVKIADSLQQIDSNIGTNGAILPVSIDIQGITFSTTHDQTILSMTAAANVSFKQSKFSGPQVLPSTIGAGNQCVTLISFPALNITNVDFSDCEFSGLGYAVTADDDMQHIVFTRCYYHDLFQTFVLGKNTNGIGAAIHGPTAFRVSNSYFNKVYDIALNVYNISGITSYSNYYGDVANANLGLGNPTNNIISFLGSDNQSVGDIFLRNDTDNAVFGRIALNSASNYFVLPHIGEQNGVYRTGPGVSATLADNTASPTATPITFSTLSADSYIIEYSIIRGTNTRTGSIKVAISSAGQTLSDDALEAASPTGVTFSLSALSGNNVTLNYITTSQGINAAFRYVVKRFTLA